MRGPRRYSFSFHSDSRERQERAQSPLLTTPEATPASELLAAIDQANILPSEGALQGSISRSGRHDLPVAAAETGLTYANSENVKKALNDILAMAKERVGR